MTVAVVLCGILGGMAGMAMFAVIGHGLLAAAVTYWTGGMAGVIALIFMTVLRNPQGFRSSP